MSSGIPWPYAKQDALTDPVSLAGLYEDLPKDPSALRDIVSQLIVHVSWAAGYGFSSDLAMPRDTLAVVDRLKAIQTAFPGSLAAQRPAEKRTFGTCRDYSLMLCSMLRQRSVPARVRCGFATYFSQAPYEDHWVCEYWSPDHTRWIRADAQLDQLQRDELSITFDCADLPDGVFLSGGQAWTLARSGAAAPGDFGHGEARGSWFLQINLHRDLLALANQHMSAWDTWRNATASSRMLGDADIASGDHLARAIEMAECAADGITQLREMAARHRTPPWPSP